MSTKSPTGLEDLKVSHLLHIAYSVGGGGGDVHYPSS